MLLPLLGACAVVGPFQGPEWEPVRGLLSQDQSCKDPRCCGNLLVSCLFLIWQIQQYWHHLSRTRKRNVTKMPPQRRRVSSAPQDTYVGVIPEFFTHGKNRDLDVHIEQWMQKRRWGYQKTVRQQWDTQYLLSPQKPFRDRSWDVHTSTEPIFCTSSFSSTCLLPQDSSLEAWQLPWYPRDSQAHPSLAICQRTKQLLDPSHTLVPAEPLSLRYTSTTLAFSLQNFPLAQSPNFCLREFLPNPVNQQLETPNKECLESPQGPLVPWDQTETAGRECSEASLQYLNQRKSRREDAQETRPSGAFCPIDSGVKEDEQAEALGYRDQRQERRKTDGKISVPGWERQTQVRAAEREQTEKPQRKAQKEPGEENPSSRAYMGENKEQFRCKTDIETQIPAWVDQEDAVETPAMGTNEEAARGKEEVEAQGLENQDWMGSKAAENSQVLKWGTQDQIGGNTGTETEVEEGRNKDQIGSGDGVKIQTSGRENLREFKQRDNEKTQALGWEKQGCIRTENDVQTPAGEHGGQSSSENHGKTQASKVENQNLSRQEVKLGLRKLREVREEDWVVIQAPWWGSQRLGLITVDRGLMIPCCRDQSQVRGEYTVDISSLESDQREGGDAGAASSVTPEAEAQAQSMETYPVPSQDEEKTEEENGTVALAQGKRNLREVYSTDEAQTQKLGEENQGQLGNEFHKMIHGPKRKNQKQVRGNDHVNNQTSETEKWAELTSKKGDTTHVAGCEEAEEAKGEDCTEGMRIGMRILRGAGGEEGTEIKAAMEENQSRLGDVGTNTHSSELENQKEMGSEDATEARAPEQGNQTGPGDNDVKTQRPERQSRGQLAEAGGIGEQAKGESASENGASEKKNWAKAAREDCRKMQGPRRKDQRLLGEVDGKTYRLEWKNQENFRDGNDAENQKQGKRNPLCFTGDDGSDTRASVGEDQRLSVYETDGKSQTQRQRNQSKCRGTATEIQNGGVQRKRRAEGSKLSHPSRRGDKGRVGRKDAVRPCPPNDSSGKVGPARQKCSSAQPASLTSGYGTGRHKQSVAGNGVDSAPCSEEHVSCQGRAPARKHRREVSERTQRAQAGSQRRQERVKRVDLGKASSPTCQDPYPQSQTSSVFPSLLCPQVSQAAPAVACAPVALKTFHKWPALKKSKHLLLESLMKRRIAHLRWGLPRRILESYLLFHFLESCSSPLAGGRLSGSRLDRQCQWQQERYCESQASLLGLESPVGAQRHPVLEKRSSKLCTQVQAVEKHRPTKLEPTDSSIPPKKPRRIRPPGGARESQIQEEAPKAKIPVPRNPRPAVESRSWHNPGGVPEFSIENSRSREMVRPGVSHVEEKTSSRTKASSSPGGCNYLKKEFGPREASGIPTNKCSQPTGGKTESVGPSEDRKRACSAHTSSFKGSIHSAAARLSISLWSKMAWSTQLAKPQHSTPFLTPRNPTPPNKVEASYTDENRSRFPTALEKDPGPPRGTVPKIESYQEHKTTPGNSTGAPHNPAVSQRFGFMRHLRHFLRQYGLKK